MLLGLAFSAQAQDISKNALGLRLGDNDGFGGELSYQRGYTNGFGILKVVSTGMLVLEVELVRGVLIKNMVTEAELFYS